MRNLQSTSVSLSLLFLLSTVIGFPSHSEADVRIGKERQGTPHLLHLNEKKESDFLDTQHDLEEPAPRHQQAEKNYWKEFKLPDGVNEVLWADVVRTALESPFHWTKLSRALDTLEKDFLNHSPMRSLNSEKMNPEVRNGTSESRSRSSRWNFTYHRVLTFLRNSTSPGYRRLSAIAAMSASEIRPSPPSSLHPPSSSPLITSILFHHTPRKSSPEDPHQPTLPSVLSLDDKVTLTHSQEKLGYNEDGENDYEGNGGSSSFPRRNSVESWRKLSGRSRETRTEPHARYHHHHILYSHHQHQKRHDPLK